MSNLEIYDCTLREGEQAAGATFNLEDRIELAKQLDEFGVDYIELGWPLASEEIIEAFHRCKPLIKKAKIVAFGSTSIKEAPEKDENLNLILKSGAEYACIFGKTWLEHVEKQLRISKEANLKRISESVKFLKKNGLKVFYDAEHFFDGFKSDKNYAIETLISATKAEADRLILCDTNGGALPNEVESIVRETKFSLIERGIEVDLGVHLHDDCGLALANTLISLPYIKQVQGTINGIGERVGNLNFSEFLPVYTLKLGNKLENIDLKKLREINENAFRLAGIATPELRAFVGETAFAHKGGVHIDATAKGACYEHISPEAVGNRRIVLLNTLGGASCVTGVAEQFGYKLDKKDPNIQERVRRLFKELRRHEEEGYRLSAIRAEQFLLVEKYFGEMHDFFEVEGWEIRTGRYSGKDKSTFKLKCRIDGEELEKSLDIEGGPVDAAYKAFASLLSKKYLEANNLKLLDFHVSIARFKREESSVRTIIYFLDNEEFETVGVDSNILSSSIEALTKGFQYYLQKTRKEKAI